ncbi:kinase-like domain-containing protein [Cryomyces antarcticus]
MAMSPTETVAPSSNTKNTFVRTKPPEASQTSNSSATNHDKPRSAPAPQLFESLNDEEKRKYVKDKQVGKGTYADVFVGHFASSPSTKIAIKKIRFNAEFKDGISMDTIREIRALQELRHPNIIALYSVFSSKNQNLNLVLEYCPRGDLMELIRDTDNVHYGTADIKAWMGMLCRAVWFCHENFILHRDIKPNNLLIAADGELKLADFGLARSFAEPETRMTYNMITRFYRPPELFYQARHYSGVVDVWSVGCVMANLVLRFPFIQGDTDIETANKISETIGTPTEDNWPGVTQLKAYLAPTNIVPVKRKPFYMDLFSSLGSSGVDLMMSMFVLDPRKRATSKQVLQHQWWQQEPRPSRKEDLPKRGGGVEVMGEDLKRRGGELPAEGRADKVARKIDFGAMKK